MERIPEICKLFGCREDILKPIKIIAGLLIILFFTTGCNGKKEVLLSGKTMGTTYHITILTGYFQNSDDLKDKIDHRLKEINQSMSTYIGDSEISRFNASRKNGERIKVSADFLAVMAVAEKIYQLTGGAWDPTVGPLVNLWGFGSAGEKNRVPRKDEIQARLPEIGFKHIDITAQGFLVKKKPDISLDLNSIAKGFAVDAVSDLIRKQDLENYLVEIGGEIYASGLRTDGKPWRVGINRPQIDAPFNQVYKVVLLRNQAFATSGDYRNFFILNGKRYSHVIDPRTGYPVANGVVSVSILADTCTFADGLATAIMVLGPESGLELVNRIDNVECLIVVEEKSGALKDYFSSGFKDYL
jgi:thiamine biosynthesis lipoprotein